MQTLACSTHAFRVETCCAPCGEQCRARFAVSASATVGLSSLLCRTLLPTGHRARMSGLRTVRDTSTWRQVTFSADKQATLQGLQCHCVPHRLKTLVIRFQCTKIAGIGVVSTGHCHPKVVKAIQDQAAQLIFAQQNVFASSKPMVCLDIDHDVVCRINT